MTKASADKMKRMHRKLVEQVSKSVGRRIAERRVHAGMTQTDIGTPLGVSMQQAQRYEAGESTLDVAALVSIARTLGCTPADLVVDFMEEGGGAPAPLSPDAVAIGQMVDRLESGGLRAIVKTLAQELIKYEGRRAKDEG